MMDPNPDASTHKARFAAFEGATNCVKVPPNCVKVPPTLVPATPYLVMRPQIPHCPRAAPLGSLPLHSGGRRLQYSLETVGQWGYPAAEWTSRLIMLPHHES